MAFQVSPGVSVTEKDLTNIVPAVSTTAGGIVMTAEKGPVDEITTISSEQELVDIFGKPNAKIDILLTILTNKFLKVLKLFKGKNPC